MSAAVGIFWPAPYSRDMAEILQHEAVDGLELKVRRVRARLTLYELGQRAGLHAARISEMERGQRPVAKSVVEALDEALRS